MNVREHLFAGALVGFISVFALSPAYANPAVEKAATGTTLSAAQVNQVVAIVDSLTAITGSVSQSTISGIISSILNTSTSSLDERPVFQFDREGFQTTDSGASAGGADGKLAMWVNGGYSTFDEDQAAIDSDGDTFSLAVGGDWKFSDRLTAGVSLAYSNSDVTTTFNDGNVDTTGYTVAPYFVAILGRNQNVLLDGMVGYTMNDNDADRATNTITSSYDSGGWLANANVTYLLTRGRFIVQPKIGLLWSDTTTDGYTESGGLVVAETDSQLGRLSVGGRVDYVLSEKFVPYISLQGEYDFESEDYSSFTGANRPSQEDTGATLGVGASLQFSDRTSGSIGATTALGRDDYSAYTLSGTLRFSF
tara:strand:- start:71 stop:1162 length:1092 start_codon:yes stop_codon:yes gene_type:complete